MGASVILKFEKILFEKYLCKNKKLFSYFVVFVAFGFKTVGKMGKCFSSFWVAK